MKQIKMINVQNETDKVLAALGLADTDIACSYLQGVVKLSGMVKNCGQKAIVEEVAKQVIGVNDVVSQIVVENYQGILPADDSIRVQIQSAFKNHWLIPHQKIAVAVTSGNVSLEGIVQWEYQKARAISIAQNIEGVNQVMDHILIHSDIANAIDLIAVEEALKNNWALNSERINVSFSDNTVYLNGTVSSLAEKDLAEQIAWHVKGVWSVENNLVLDY